jgi:hypothetical protein
MTALGAIPVKILLPGGFVLPCEFPAPPSTGDLIRFNGGAISARIRDVVYVVQTTDEKPAALPAVQVVLDPAGWQDAWTEQLIGGSIESPVTDASASERVPGAGPYRWRPRSMRDATVEAFNSAVAGAIYEVDYSFEWNEELHNDAIGNLAFQASLDDDEDQLPPGHLLDSLCDTAVRELVRLGVIKGGTKVDPDPEVFSILRTLAAGAFLCGCEAAQVALGNSDAPEVTHLPQPRRERPPSGVLAGRRHRGRRR